MSVTIPSPRLRVALSRPCLQKKPDAVLIGTLVRLGVIQNFCNSVMQRSGGRA